MKELSELLNQPVVVMTTDGRVLGGLLHSYDGNFNLTLKRSHERIYPVQALDTEGEAKRPRMDNDQGGGVKAVQLQSMVLRGDCVVCIGRVDRQREAAVDFATMSVPHPLKQITP